METFAINTCASYTIVVALKHLREFDRAYFRKLLSDNPECFIIIKVSHKARRIYLRRRFKVVLCPDASLYEAWNQVLHMIRSKYVCFLGVGDLLVNFSADNLMDNSDIIKPDGKRTFWHCGTFYKTELLREVPFNCDLKILGDLYQFAELDDKFLLQIKNGEYHVEMKPGGISYYFSRRLLLEYLVVAVKRPKLFFYVAKKIVYFTIYRRFGHD